MNKTPEEVLAAWASSEPLPPLADLHEALRVSIAQRDKEVRVAAILRKGMRHYREAAEATRAERDAAYSAIGHLNNKIKSSFESLSVGAQKALDGAFEDGVTKGLLIAVGMAEESSQVRDLRDALMNKVQERIVAKDLALDGLGNV